MQPVVVGLIPGHRYQVADLFRALLLISANDAAVTLAQASGSVSKGIALMNAEARRLQAYDVVARQPNGLPAPGQVESAYDEALIARQALSMPAFMKYDSTLAARFPVTRRKVITLVNQNRLLTDYQGGIGGKIGWTIAAAATYIGLARRHGITLIVTILHCTALQEITAAERLRDWGFAMDHKVRPVGALVPPLRSSAGSRRTSTAEPRKPASARPAQPRSVSSRPAQPRGASTHRAQPRGAGTRAAGPRSARIHAAGPAMTRQASPRQAWPSAPASQPPQCSASAAWPDRGDARLPLAGTGPAYAASAERHSRTLLRHGGRCGAPAAGRSSLPPARSPQA